MNSKNDAVFRLSFLFLILCGLLAFAPAGRATDELGEDGEDRLPAAAPQTAPVEPLGKGVVLLAGSGKAVFQLTVPKAQSAGSGFVLLAPDGARHPLTVTRVRGGTITFSLDRVPGEGAYQLALVQSSAAQPTVITEQAVRVIRRFRIALTFDDGPATGGDPEDGDFTASPTFKVLEALDQYRHGSHESLRGVKAAFFVLTQPDTFLRDRFLKAETRDGCALLKEEARRGHVIGVHWGGRYVGQTVCHTRRVGLPGYEWWKDPKAAAPGVGGEVAGANALESDLRECIARIQQCAGVTPRFMRPPLWRFSDPKNPAIQREVLATYQRLNLKMILTDAKYPDGGYAIIAIICPNEMSKFQENLRRAYLGGEEDLVVSMHDSNSHTANRLLQVLDLIKSTFAQVEFGGVKGDPGERLEFTTSADEVAALLQRKARFTMFPAYR